MTLRSGLVLSFLMVAPPLGVLATATGLLFYGQPNGGFMAVDQRDGRTLWRFPSNVRMKASPMTFAVDGQQYVAVAAGPNILCFGL